MKQEKRLESIIKQIKKTFGEGSIMKMDRETRPEVDAVSTGSLLLDMATGIGGYPKGRIVEIFGEESTGKTTFALLAISEHQKKGGICAFIDAEHSLDINYAETLGVDLKDLIISQPDYGEQALEITHSLVKSEAISLIVVDSVAALVPRSELEGSMGEGKIGLQARLMSQGIRKIAISAYKTGTTVIFINQLRSKIGVLYGPNTTTTGGNALKFYASMRIELKRREILKDGEKKIGQKIQITVVKNKLSPPYRNCVVPIYFGKGPDRNEEILELGLQKNIITKEGSWYCFSDKKLGHGKQKAILTLCQDPQIAAMIMESA